MQRYNQLKGIVPVKYYAWLGLQEPWCCQRQERRAKTAGSTDSPTLCPHMGSRRMSLQGTKDDNVQQVHEQNEEVRLQICNLKGY